MIEILLTKGCIAVIDDCDKELCRFKWHSFGKEGAYYGRRTFRESALKYTQQNKKQYQSLHHAVMERIVGYSIPASTKIDHKDGNRMNNARCNLRIATSAQNGQNAKMFSTNKTGLKGVTYRAKDNRYEASIKANGVWKYLGRYSTPEAAHEAYKIAARELHGEFARFE